MKSLTMDQINSMIRVIGAREDSQILWIRDREGKTIEREKVNQICETSNGFAGI